MSKRLLAAIAMMARFTCALVPHASTARRPGNMRRYATSMGLGSKSTAGDVLDALGRNGRSGTAVVTGGNSGIGSKSVETLAAAGYDVVLCSRSVPAGMAALQSMDLTEQARSRVRVQQLDLADLESVKAAADDIIASGCSVSILLNNAGIMACPKELTAQGIESQFGVNHVGHYFFTRLLLPCIEDRVVTVASTAHAFGELDLTDASYENGRKYSRWGAYGQSKLANILFAKALSAELKAAESRVSSFSLHPGVINTNLSRSLPSILSWGFGSLLTDKNIDQGAATSIYACLAPASGLAGGSYLSDCGIATPNAAGRSEESARELWTWTEDKLVELGYPVPAVAVTCP